MRESRSKRRRFDKNGTRCGAIALATAIALAVRPAGAVTRMRAITLAPITGPADAVASASLVTALAVGAPSADSVAPAPAAIRMTVLGDSLAFGTGASDPKNALAFRIYRAILARRPGSEVTNDAIGGTRAADVTRLEVPQVEARTDLVLVIVGGNDVVRRTPPRQFASDYGRLLAAIRARAPHAVVVAFGVPDVARSPLFADSYAKTEALARADDAAVRAATRTYGTAYVDLFTVTKTEGTNPDFFSSDDFHPSDAGYAQLARAALPVILRAIAHESTRTSSSQTIPRPAR